MYRSTLGLASLVCLPLPCPGVLCSYPRKMMSCCHAAHTNEWKTPQPDHNKAASLARMVRCAINRACLYKVKSSALVYEVVDTASRLVDGGYVPIHIQIFVCRVCRHAEPYLRPESTKSCTEIPRSNKVFLKMIVT